ncbi:MAG: ABC transporter ATP-binding protein [Solirubrobacterales bacterium]|nr:ABC transporter ATP-binding protein [Solirubrobacterales bacterium]MBV9714348.1 ABC transporter ATP-binding protein [Solirubrobacterales bacterium]
MADSTRPALEPRASTRPALELRGITKKFGSVVANDRVDFDVYPGEVHALLGENGAGKSTLVSVLYGLYTPNEGEIVVDGRPVEIDSPATAIRLGIGMVHQHFMLVPVMTVAENLVLGHEPTRSGGLLDLKAARARVREISERYGLAVDPDATIEDVTVGTQQRVEILRALYRGARILVLDEPTAVLTAQEVQELMDVLQRLKQDGTGIVFISHKLGEVLQVADRITVLRHGRKIDTVRREGATEQSLARLVVGREVLLTVEKSQAHAAEPMLVVEHLHVRDDRDLEAVDDVSLSVRAGEIVAIAGVDGNGQQELVEAITGLRAPAEGRIVVDGHDITRKGVSAATDAAVAHIPEDRHRRGLVLPFTLAENLALREFRRPELSARGWLRTGRIRSRATALLREYDVRGGGPDAYASSLSGGNQQKVAIAREIASDPKLLVAHQPTRGLDVGAIEFVHRRLIEERDRGRAILLVSLEYEEVRSLADRILVIYEGRIMGEFAPDASEEELGMAMTGRQAAAAG